MIRCSVCCEHVVGYMARYVAGYFVDALFDMSMLLE